MSPFLEPVLIEAAKHQTARYDRYETTKLDVWSRGKVALVGDACGMRCVPRSRKAPAAPWVNSLSFAEWSWKRYRMSEEALGSPGEKRIRPITDRLSGNSGNMRPTGHSPKAINSPRGSTEAARYDPVKRG